MSSLARAPSTAAVVSERAAALSHRGSSARLRAWARKSIRSCSSPRIRLPPAVQCMYGHRLWHVRPALPDIAVHTSTVAGLGIDLDMLAYPCSCGQDKKGCTGYVACGNAFQSSTSFVHKLSGLQLLGPVRQAISLCSCLQQWKAVGMVHSWHGAQVLQPLWVHTTPSSETKVVEGERAVPMTILCGTPMHAKSSLRTSNQAPVIRRNPLSVNGLRYYPLDGHKQRQG